MCMCNMCMHARAALRTIGAGLPTRQQPTAANPAPQPAFDATLVGRRVLALWGDSDEEPPRFEWFGATIVNFRAGPRITYRIVMHFDDGTTELVQLPDETVQILDETVSLCTCERCVTCEDAGRTLPLS